MKTEITFFLTSIALLCGVFLLYTPVRTDGFTIVISEIGAYEASGEEWIEITNVSDSTIDLTDWKFLEADTNHGLTLVRGDALSLTPGEYAVVTQNDEAFTLLYPSSTVKLIDSSWSTLNESGEEIGIKNADGDIVEQFTYISAADFSLERIDLLDGDYTVKNWKENPEGNSVGKQNFWYEEHIDVPEENIPPTAAIKAVVTSSIDTDVVFDGTSSFDSGGSISSYVWQVDDVLLGTESTTVYAFSTTGTYTMLLTVTDDIGAVASTTHSIEIISNEVDTVSTTTVTSTMSTSSITINEFLTNPNDGDEWIELYNMGTSTVDLTEYQISDGVSVIASPTSSVSAGSFFVIELSNSKLNNGGDIIVLANGEDVVDSVAYGSWDEAVLDVPEKGNTIARNIDGVGNFEETTKQTKGTANSITSPVIDTPSGGGGSNAEAPEYSARDIVINELVSDPTDGEVEFIELYNRTNAAISLAGWYILDGSEAKTMLSGTIASNGFVVVTKPKGNLNNAGDTVALFAPLDTEIDRVTYGAWQDDNLSDNAPVPGDPTSLARILDGQDSDYDLYDFALTHTVTEGKANIIATVLGEFVSADGLALRGSIVLSEVLPNPVGSDAEAEFIELYNAGETSVSLDEWKMGDGSKTRYIFSGVTMPAGTYLTLYRTETSIALNNSGGETITLYNPAGDVIDQTVYTGSAKEGDSYMRDGDVWLWTSSATPDASNIVSRTASAPQIIIDVDTHVAVGGNVQFDASDTTDADNDTLFFTWDFGDGNTDEGDVVEHVYDSEGVFTAVLTVSDGTGSESSKEVIITVKHGAIGGTAAVDATHIQITEFLPNPKGSDSTEFIELFNPTGEEIDISGLKLDDEEGGSRAYTIPSGTLLGAGEYVVFGKQDTKLALNNTNDSVRLLYPNGVIIVAVAYDDVREGASYSLSEEGVWAWSGTQTPGDTSIITYPILAASTRKVSNRSNYAKPVIETTLEALRQEDIGDTVTVTGVVAVEPGVLGSQYFYIVGSPGVQVYMNSKDFPDLKIGDRVTVTGEISEAYGETRLKVREQSSIDVMDHVGLPIAHPLDIDAIGEPYEGWLAEVHGEITEIKSTYMYVDDGTAELRVYFKRGASIPANTFELGELVQVTGIVSQTKNGYQLLPRSSADVLTTGFATAAVMQQQVVKEENQAEAIEKYLTATAGGLTAIIMGLGLKTQGGRLQITFYQTLKFFRRKKKK